MPEPSDSESTTQPDRGAQAPRKPEVGERVGGFLGKAFLRVKTARVWKDTRQSYRDALEGKK
jgi:hypothetical protein